MGGWVRQSEAVALTSGATTSKSCSLGTLVLRCFCLHNCVLYGSTSAKQQDRTFSKRTSTPRSRRLRAYPQDIEPAFAAPNTQTTAPGRDFSRIAYKVRYTVPCSIRRYDTIRYLRCGTPDRLVLADRITRYGRRFDAANGGTKRNRMFTVRKKRCSTVPDCVFLAGAGVRCRLCSRWPTTCLPLESHSPTSVKTDKKQRNTRVVAAVVVAMVTVTVALLCVFSRLKAVLNST